MSAAHHDRAAARETRTASAHETSYDASAAVPLRCGDAPIVDGASACWTIEVNPTAEHRAEAERHRSAAAEHRGAAAALREIEARECVGLSEVDRDTSPFYHRDDIASVAPLNDSLPQARDRTPQLVGATVTFRPVRGLTVEWLQRILDCHLARNVTLGHNLPEMSYCPLVPMGVTATARAVASGIAVDLRSGERATAIEVLRRAEALVPSRPLTGSGPARDYR
jgi:hypothetical protein